VCVHSLEQEIALLQRVSTPQVADHTVILADNTHMVGIVISVAEELSRDIDVLNQLVRTYRIRFSKMKVSDDEIFTETVIETHPHPGLTSVIIPLSLLLAYLNL
jgi:hypothetical protein